MIQRDNGTELTHIFSEYYHTAAMQKIDSSEKVWIVWTVFFLENAKAFFIISDNR